MKKLIALMLGLTVFLAACGGEAPARETGSGETRAPEVQAKEESVPFEEITVVDNEFCAIRLTDVDPDSSMGYGVKALLENKSPDVTYMFAVTNGAINGLSVNPFFAREVAPGKKANVEINFFLDALTARADLNYSDIELNFRVYDSNNYMADPVALAGAHVYPMGQDKAARFVREPLSTDLVLVDNEDLAVTVLGFDTNPDWGYSIDLYLENRTDTTLMYTVEDTSINGFMADPFFARDLAPGKCGFVQMSWTTDDLTGNGIEAVEQIEMILRAYDNVDWSAGDVYKAPVTLNP